jgi:hypothetical protein
MVHTAPLLAAGLGLLLRGLLRRFFLFLVIVVQIHLVLIIILQVVLAAALAAALMLTVKLLCNIRIAIPLEVFVCTLLVFVCRASINGYDLVVTEVDVL